MTIEIDRKTLIERADDTGLSIPPYYSGRAMNGRHCVAVIGGPGDLLRFILEVVPAVDSYATDGTYREEWFDVRTDSLGMDQIFYWPGVRAIDVDE